MIKFNGFFDQNDYILFFGHSQQFGALMNLLV